jgi:hypothetical protein
MTLDLYCLGVAVWLLFHDIFSFQKIKKAATVSVIKERLHCPLNLRRDFLDLENGGSKLLRNVSNYLQINIAS